MQRFAYLRFAGRSVELGYPAELANLVPPLLGAAAQPEGGEPLARLAILAEGVERYTLMAGSESVATGGLGQIIYEALVAAERLLCADLGDRLLLHAAAVSRGGKAVLLAGESHSGKSTVAAALSAWGFGLMSDEITTLAADGLLDGLRRPLSLRPDVWNDVSQLGWVTQAVSLADGHRLAQAPGERPGPARCGLIIVPHFVAGETPRLERVAPARASALLMARNHSWQHAPDHGFGAMLALAGAVPAVQLVYGDVNRLAPLVGFIDTVLAGRREALEGALAAANRSLAAPVASTSAGPVVSMPAPTLKRGPVRLTIGMATYADYDGVYFTIQSLRLNHPDVLADAEIVVIDNHPQGVEASHLKAIESFAPNFRYVPLPDAVGAAGSKQRIFEEAEGRYVLALDCHVLLAPGAIARLLDYFAHHPATDDLLQGPLLYDDLTNISTHWSPVWSGGMYGQWATDERGRDADGAPFEIPMCGMGLFAARRASWLGFNPRFRGFGGEEGYIHEKYRQAGRRTLCLPFLRWVHRFARPGGLPYVNRWEDRMFNYAVGHAELGLPMAEMEAHFAELLGKDVAGDILGGIHRELGAEPKAARAAG